MTRSRLRGPQRHQQVLDEALETFGVVGYAEASMADMANVAGITKPLVSQHFASKRALFIEVLDECGRPMKTSIEKATADAATAREQVEEGFSAFVRFFSDNPAAFRAMFTEVNRRTPSSPTTCIASKWW